MHFFKRMRLSPYVLTEKGRTDQEFLGISSTKKKKSEYSPLFLPTLKR